MLSVVIPTRNKSASLRITLAMLAGQSCSLPYEVVVVDDGCTDGTRRMLERMRSRSDWSLRVVDGPRLGRAGARNAGARATRGQRLLFLDDDVLTGRGHLEAHQRQGERTFAHGPLREFVGARRWMERYADADPQETAVRGTSVLAGAAGRLLTNTLESLINAMDDGSVPPVAPWAAFVGANTSVSRAVFDELQGFDEAFGQGWGCEDLEFGARLVDAGVRPVVLPEAAGVHLTHARPDRWEQHDVNLRHFLARHDLPAVRLLPLLLSEGGGVQEYVGACVEAARRLGDAAHSPATKGH